jgi:hypothetical protein
MSVHDAIRIMALAILLLGIVLGCGSRRKIVVFSNYDDLGLTFLVPVSAFVITYLFMWLGGTPKVGAAVGAVVGFAVLIKVVINAYLANGRRLPHTLLSIVTKLPLSVIWVLGLIQVVSPSGNTQRQRSSSRQTGLLVLLVVTPIIGLLVADKTGSLFNPRSWLSGMRVGSIRNHL